MFYFDNPLRICENIRGRKKAVFRAWLFTMYVNTILPGYCHREWSGQTPFMMPIAAAGNGLLNTDPGIAYRDK